MSITFCHPQPASSTHPCQVNFLLACPPQPTVRRVPSSRRIIPTCHARELWQPLRATWHAFLTLSPVLMLWMTCCTLIRFPDRPGWSLLCPPSIRTHFKLSSPMTTPTLQTPETRPRSSKISAPYAAPAPPAAPLSVAPWTGFRCGTGCPPRPHRAARIW